MVVGILNSDDRFAAFAISPFFWNVAIIAVLVALAPTFSEEDEIYAYAIGVLVGTVIQLAIPTWDLRNTDFHFKMIWEVPRSLSPDVRRVLLLMLPVTISLGLINFNLLINSFFGTFVSEQAPAAIDKAFRIYMLPQGIFSVAIATVVFPTLARFAAREEFDELRATMANGMRQILLMLIPAAAAILVLSEPMVRLVYERGEFDAAQTELVADGALLVRLLAAVQRALPDLHPHLLQPPAPVDPDLDLGDQPGDHRRRVGRPLRPVRRRRHRRRHGDRDRRQRRRRGLDPPPRARRHRAREADRSTVRITAASALLAGVSYLVWLGLDDALGRSVLAQIASLGDGADRRRRRLLRGGHRPARARGRPGPAAARGAPLPGS